MKQFNQYNFFKHTFCEFKEVTNFTFPENTNYKSKSQSTYFYTTEGVYRKSNHWGRVANCKWKLITNHTYKNQKMVIGFAKWTDFYPINSLEKNYFIEVDFNKKVANLQPKKENTTNYLFTFFEGTKKIKQIKQLFKDDKWATYYTCPVVTLRQNIIAEFINSKKTLQEIKTRLK